MAAAAVDVLVLLATPDRAMAACGDRVANQEFNLANVNGSPGGIAVDFTNAFIDPFCKGTGMVCTSGPGVYGAAWSGMANPGLADWFQVLAAGWTASRVYGRPRRPCMAGS